MFDARLLADTITVYLAPTYSNDAAGGPNMTILGSGTMVSAHVNIANVELAQENQQEGELITWDISVLQSELPTPNMKAIVLINTMGGVTINKYARVLSHEAVFPPNSLIEPYHQLVCQEARECG